MFKTLLLTTALTLATLPAAQAAPAAAKGGLGQIFAEAFGLGALPAATFCGAHDDDDCDDDRDDRDDDRDEDDRDDDRGDDRDDDGDDGDDD
jgi:hypothetical protein